MLNRVKGRNVSERPGGRQRLCSDIVSKLRLNNASGHSFVVMAVVAARCYQGSFAVMVIVILVSLLSL